MSNGIAGIISGVQGFNKILINDIINEICDSYEELQNVANIDFQNKVIEKLEQAWFAPEAVTIVSQIVEREKDILYKAYSLYCSLYKSVVIAAQKWSFAVGDSEFMPSRGEPIYSPIVDASGMKSDNNGFRGIYSDEIESISTELVKINLEIKEILGNMEAFIAKDTYFYGESQNENLEALVKNMSLQIQNLTSENYNSIIEGVKETKEKYTGTAQANAQRFSGGN